MVLDKLLERLFPYIPSRFLLNLGLFADPERELAACGRCGSTRLRRNGLVYTATMSYRRVICKECGNYMKERVRENRTEFGLV